MIFPISHDRNMTHTCTRRSTVRGRHEGKSLVCDCCCILAATKQRASELEGWRDTDMIQQQQSETTLKFRGFHGPAWLGVAPAHPKQEAREKTRGRKRYARRCAKKVGCLRGEILEVPRCFRVQYCSYCAYSHTACTRGISGFSTAVDTACTCKYFGGRYCGYSP